MSLSGNELKNVSPFKVVDEVGPLGVDDDLSKMAHLDVSLGEEALGVDEPNANEPDVRVQNV